MEKNKKIIIGATAAAVAVAIGAVVLTQGARLKTAASVARSATMNEEQVTAINDENAQITQDIQDQYQIPDITLTPEMEAAIADGSMTLEEAAAQLLSGREAQSEAATESEAETPNAESAAQAAETAPEAADDAQSAPEIAVETPEPSAPEETAPMPEPQKPESGASMPEPSATQSAAPMPEPEKPTEPEETAALSGETGGGPAEAQADAGQTEAAQRPDSGQTEAAQRPDSGQTEAASADSGQTQAPEKSEAEKAKEAADAKAQNLIAQLYVLKNSFNSQVDGIIAECIEEFLALDPSEQTRAAKLRIVYSRLDKLQAMEADCDAQVENIAAQLDEIDPALGEKARQYYKNEKELKKASLISQYGG